CPATLIGATDIWQIDILPQVHVQSYSQLSNRTNTGGCNWLARVEAWIDGLQHSDVHMDHSTEKAFAGWNSERGSTYAGKDWGAEGKHWLLFTNNPEAGYAWDLRDWSHAVTFVSGGGGGPDECDPNAGSGGDA